MRARAVDRAPATKTQLAGAVALLAFLARALLGCGTEVTAGGMSSAPASAATSAAGTSGTSGATAREDASGADGAVPALRGLAERCKLINDRHLDDPTPNQTHTRANLRGTDLGIPVAHGNDLYFFFGDTAGSRAIWPLGLESLPDAVGYSAVPRSVVAEDPSTLCHALRFLSGSPQASAGRAHDGRIERDFAAGAMTPPAGHDIGEYIHNPAGPRGQNAFRQLPGDFEVPSGAFSYGGSVYVFYTTVVSASVLEMKGSYLARWRAPSTSGLPSYEILHHVDQRFDDRGALRGDFINIAPVVVGEHVYLYGTGAYRKSDVHLARKRLADVDREGAIERFDAATDTWSPVRAAPAAPVVSGGGIGELSVRYFPALGRFVMMDQEIDGTENRIVARFASRPEGPWSAAVTVASLSDPAFRDVYCCTARGCEGPRLLHCDRAGFYAPYMLPDVATHPDGSFSIDFTMSTWDPYDVALMSATFR